VLESISLVAAVKAIYASAKATDMSFWGYVKNGTDPMGTISIIFIYMRCVYDEGSN
jgi:hypothetical protein